MEGQSRAAAGIGLSNLALEYRSVADLYLEQGAIQPADASPLQKLRCATGAFDNKPHMHLGHGFHILQHSQTGNNGRSKSLEKIARPAQT